MKKRALLIGEYTDVTYHPLTGVDNEIKELLKDSFTVDIMEDYQKLDSKKMSEYDLLISYVDVGCCAKKLGEDKGFVSAVVPYLIDGGGLLCIHSGIFLQHCHEMTTVLGARLMKHPPYVKNMEIVCCPSAHPIVEGMTDFKIDDEPYTFEMNVFTVREPLLNYRFGNEVHPAAWCHNYGDGRVVYTSLGHNEYSFRVPEYREFVRRSAIWAAGEAL